MSNPWRYHFISYPVHQGKINLYHPISMNCDSVDLFLTMTGVISERP